MMHCPEQEGQDTHYYGVYVSPQLVISHQHHIAIFQYWIDIRDQEVVSEGLVLEGPMDLFQNCTSEISQLVGFILLVETADLTRLCNQLKLTI